MATPITVDKSRINEINELTSLHIGGGKIVKEHFELDDAGDPKESIVLHIPAECLITKVIVVPIIASGDGATFDVKVGATSVIGAAARDVIGTVTSNNVEIFSGSGIEVSITPSAEVLDGVSHLIVEYYNPNTGTGLFLNTN